MGTYRCCLIFKRRFRWSDAPPPDDVRALFEQHAGTGPHMDADGLRCYLDTTGHDSLDADRLLDQIRQGRTRIPRVESPSMPWLACSIAATLSSPRGEPDSDTDESEPASADRPAPEEASPRNPNPDAEEPEQPRHLRTHRDTHPPTLERRILPRATACGVLDPAR